MPEIYRSHEVRPSPSRLGVYPPFRVAARAQARGFVLGTIALAVAAFVSLIAAVNIAYAHYELSKTIREHPELLLQPVPIPVAPAFAGSPTQLDCFGVHFAAPWGTPENTRCEFSDRQKMAFLRWPDGHEFRLKWPETLIDWASLTEDPAGGPDRSFTERCFGDMTETRHDAMSKILHHVPRRPGLFNIRELLCQLVLVRWKGITLSPAPTAIYSFQTENGRGFQVGDPAYSREIWIHFYDHLDRHHCLALLAKPNTPAMTQSDVDFILHSVRYVEPRDKVPAPETGAPPAKPTSRK